MEDYKLVTNSSYSHMYSYSLCTVILSLLPFLGESFSSPLELGLTVPYSLTNRMIVKLIQAKAWSRDLKSIHLDLSLPANVCALWLQGAKACARPTEEWEAMCSRTKSSHLSQLAPKLTNLSLPDKKQKQS